MRFFLSLLVTVLLSGCAGETARNAAPPPSTDSAVTGLNQLEPVERRAILAAEGEIGAACAQGRTEADIGRGAYVQFDECATGIYEKHLFPVTLYQDEFSTYRAASLDAAQRYQQGQIPFARLQDLEKTAWLEYLAQRQMKPLSSKQRFEMEDAESRARFDSVVQGTPGLPSPRCGKYGC